MISGKLSSAVCSGSGVAPYWFNAMQWFAVVSMTIDHVARLLNLSFLYSSVGRLAFPLFACLAAYSFVNLSRNHGRHILRTVGIALVAQPFFWLLFQPHAFILNICFSLFLSLLLSWVYLQYLSSKWSWSAPLLALVLASIFLSPFLEYSLYGLVLVLSWFWYWRSVKTGVVWSSRFAIVLVLVSAAGSNWDNGALAVASGCSAVLLIMILNSGFYPVVMVRRMTANTWSLYYPAHLAFLSFVSVFISVSVGVF